MSDPAGGRDVGVKAVVCRRLLAVWAMSASSSCDPRIGW